MSRSSAMLTGITLSILSGILISSTQAQEGKSGGSSLMDRLTSLRSSPLRQDAEPRKSNSKKAQSGQKNQSGQKSQGGSSPRSQGRKSSSQARSIPSRTSQSTVRPKVQLGDLLPESLFGKKLKKTKAKSTQISTKKRTSSKSSASPTRVGSDSSLSNPTKQTMTTRQTRLSPATQRENELESALVDLQSPQGPERKQQTQDRVAEDNPKESSSAVSQPPAVQTKKVAKRKILDLRQALLDDENEAEFADETTDSTAGTQSKVEQNVLQESNQPRHSNEVLNTEDKEEISDNELPEAGSLPDFSAVSESQSGTKKLMAMEMKPQTLGNVLIPNPLQDPPQEIRSEQTNIVEDPFEQSAQKAFLPAGQNSQPMLSQSPMKKESVQNSGNALQKSYQQAVIISHVEGPRSILVGHEATYEVTLENASRVKAQNLSSVIRVPAWAEVVGAVSTRGQVLRKNAESSSEGAVEWLLDELAAQTSQTLRLRIIPRSGRPLDLAVEWKQAPLLSKTVVEVQEPKLEMIINGPEEVLFGDPQRYTLLLRNPGTGITKNISVSLVPPGGDPQAAVSQAVGDLQPGENKEIQLELTARQAGNLSILATAEAAGDLSVKSIKKVLCRKPELKVDWRGPDKNYAGTVAAYYFRVKNPGTATTDPVDVQVKLPNHSSFVAASEGHSLEASTGIITWRLNGIAVNEEQFMQVRCKLKNSGKNNFEITAKTLDGSLRDTKNFQTSVVAMADLKLDVSDPPGPAAVGDTVVYEIRVRNRGTSAAENVSIVGLFSEGIDPTIVEGAQFSIRDGRVTFEPIKKLPPEHEVRLRIRASATSAGNHIFRAEAICRELDIKLAVEETTRFYEDEHRWEKGQTPYSAERNEQRLRR